MVFNCPFTTGDAGLYVANVMAAFGFVTDRQEVSPYRVFHAEGLKGSELHCLYGPRTVTQKRLSVIKLGPTAVISLQQIITASNVACDCHISGP